VVIPSTIHTWQTLYRTFGLQQPTFDGLEEQVFANYLHMFHTLEATRGLVEPSHFYELRYEDLVQDPLGHIRAIYAQLALDDITPALPKLQQYVAATATYQTNRYTLSPAFRDTITQRVGHVIRRYGYG